MKTLRERFEEKTRPGENGCVIWTAGLQSEGYGTTWFNGKDMLAHRVAYELFLGPIPDKMCVLHHCDNPRCVNPAHLWVGTRADNNRDRDSKGRQARGARMGNAKLTEVQVLEIRKLGAANELLQREIGAMYHVNGATVGLIIRRVNWAHL